MNALALIFYVVSFIAAFGWRTWVQWRSTGDTGLRLHAEPGTVQWWAKLAFVLALAAGVAAPLAGLVGLDPFEVLDDAGIRASGVVVALAGTGATIAAQWSMGASWRIGVDTSERTGLVTTGVFRHVRNPVFTAMSITALGLTLMVGNLVAVAGLVALVAALQLQVRLVEEPYLHRTHSDDSAATPPAPDASFPSSGDCARPTSKLRRELRVAGGDGGQVSATGCRALSVRRASDEAGANPTLGRTASAPTMTATTTARATAPAGMPELDEAPASAATPSSSGSSAGVCAGPASGVANGMSASDASWRSSVAMLTSTSVMGSQAKE